MWTNRLLLMVPQPQIKSPAVSSCKGPHGLLLFTHYICACPFSLFCSFPHMLQRLVHVLDPRSSNGNGYHKLRQSPPRFWCLLLLSLDSLITLITATIISDKKFCFIFCFLFKTQTLTKYMGEKRYPFTL